jgi:hypothetical protein
MKTNVRRVVIIALALTILSALPASASAGAASRFRGETAFALWATTDEAGITTAVEILATEETIVSPLFESGGAEATVAIFQGVACEGGETECPPPIIQLFGFCALPEGTFDVAPNLADAYLSGTFECVNPGVEGKQDPYTFVVTVDVLWEGVGEMFKENGNNHTQGPGIIFNWHMNGTFRFASASGSVTVNGQALPLSNLIEASLSELREGLVCLTDTPIDCPRFPSG